MSPHSFSTGYGQGKGHPSPAPHPENQTTATYTEELTYLFARKFLFPFVLLISSGLFVSVTLWQSFVWLSVFLRFK